MKSLIIAALVYFAANISHAAGADCSVYYTTDPKSLFSSNPKVVREMGTAKMNSLPGHVTIGDENYIVTMSLSKERFSASVFSVITHRLLLTGHMNMSEASNFEQAVEIVLKRFVYLTPEMSNGKKVYLTYSCVAD